MGFCRWRNLCTVILIFSTVLALHQQLVAAIRPLDGGQWLKKDGQLAFQSLQRGPVPSSGNPCTYIPGQGSGTCTLNDMNIAGPVVRSPPSFPSAIVNVGVASTGDNNESQDQDQSS